MSRCFWSQTIALTRLVLGLALLFVVPPVMATSPANTPSANPAGAPPPNAGTPTGSSAEAPPAPPPTNTPEAPPLAQNRPAAISQTTTPEAPPARETTPREPPPTAAAQTQNTAPSVPLTSDELHTSPHGKHFEVFPEDWVATAVLEVPFYSFYLGTPRLNGVAFLPNFAPDVGGSITYKSLTLKYSAPLPVPDYESTKRGDSVKQQYIISTSWHSFAIDIYYQYYLGFYVSTPVSSLIANGEPTRYAQLPDTSVHNSGLNLYYVTQPENYSVGAAFSHDEFQTKSGGSIVVNYFINHLDMNPGDTFIPGTAPGANVKPKISAGEFWSPGAAAGYGYTYVRGRYYATAQGLLGGGPQIQLFNDYQGTYQRINADIKINANLATGFNGRYDMFGAQLLFDSIYAEVEGGQLASSLLTAQIYYARRF